MVATVLNGSETYWSWLDKTMTVVNSNPTFANFNYEDIKTESLLLTGNNQYLINNYNTLQVTIPTANKATAKNSASMVKYRAVCGNLSAEANYSSNSDVTLSLSNIKDRTITVYAIDSRGFSTPVSKAISTWINYVDPSIRSASIARTGGISKETTLAFQGEFWTTEEQYDFGAVSNEITECSYKYKKSNESNYGQSINITPTINNGNISFNGTITGDAGAEGFNLSNVYNIQITIKDKIRTITYDLLLGAGSPGIAVAPRRSSFWNSIRYF